MYQNVSEIEQSAGPIASGHADAGPHYVHMIAENSTGGSTGPLARIANLVAMHGVGRDVLYANVRDDGYMIFDRPDGFQQIVADVRYYTIDDAWNLLTGAADGQWAVRDEPEPPHEIKRQMQDDVVDASDRLMCHQRPFNPGDRVRWFDQYYGECVGTLMWAQPRRGWFVQGDDGRKHGAVHEDGLTLVEHGGEREDGGKGEHQHQSGHRQEFQVRRTGQLWREAAIIQADTIVRHGGLIHFANGAKVVSSWVEGDVEVRHLCYAGA